MSGYRQDLAWIHDEGFSGFVLAAAPGILSLMRRRGIRDGRVVDLGCGGGRWAAILEKAGYETLGIDIAPAMIALARRRAPGARFRRASVLTTPLPRCDAVTALGECVSYMQGPAGGSSLTRLFRRVHRALRPGGLFVLDFAEPGRAGAAGAHRIFKEGPGWAVMVETQEDPRRRILTRRITAFRRIGSGPGGWRRSHEVHRLRLRFRAEMAAALREAGFGVRALSGYGCLTLPPGHAALEARRLEVKR